MLHNPLYSSFFSFRHLQSKSQPSSGLQSLVSTLQSRLYRVQLIEISFIFPNLLSFLRFSIVSIFSPDCIGFLLYQCLQKITVTLKSNIMKEAVVQALPAPHNNEDTTGHQSPSRHKTRCLLSQEKQVTQSSQTPPSSRRTRSQAAPDWTTQEVLILLSEIAAIDEEWLKDLSSYQRWKMVSESCMTMNVARSSSQCKLKWDTLLGDYRTIRDWESKSRDGSYWFLAEERRKNFGLPASFQKEIFDAMDAVIQVRKNQSDSNNSDPDHIDAIPELEMSCADADSVGVLVTTSRSLEMEEVTRTPKVLELEGLVGTSKSLNVEDLFTASKSLETEEVTRTSKSPDVGELVITSKIPEVVEDLVVTSKNPKVEDLITISKSHVVEDLITASKCPEKASAMAELITTTKSLEVEDLVTTTKSLEVEDLVTTTKSLEVEDLVTTTKSLEVEDLVTTTKSLEVEDLVTTSKSLEAKEFTTTSKNLEAVVLITASNFLEAEELITTTKEPTKNCALTEEELITSSKSPKLEELIATSTTPVKLTVLEEEKVINTSKSSESARVMVDNLQKNAEYVCKVVRGELQDGGTSHGPLPFPSSLKLSATQTQFARRQADELIKALTGLKNNLDELCELISMGGGCTGIKHVNSMA